MKENDLIIFKPHIIMTSQRIWQIEKLTAAQHFVGLHFIQAHIKLTVTVM